MDFKLVLLSVACFAFFVQPAQSGNLPFIIYDTVRNIAAAGTKAVQDKAAAVIKGGTDIGSIMVNGIGLNIRAIAQASGSMAEAGADGIIAVGDSISSAGNAIAADLTGNSRMLVETPVIQEVVENVRAAAPTFVEEDIVMPYEQEAMVESMPLRTVQFKVRRPATVIESRIPGGNKVSAVWNMLRDAARSKVNSARTPVVYDIIERKREQGAMYETIQI